MALKLLQITAPVAAESTIQKLAREHGCIAFYKGIEVEGDHIVFYALTKSEKRQRFLDKLQDILRSSSQARVNILPVDATIPSADTSGALHTREELYLKLQDGASAGPTYLLLAMLSTIVAIIGLLQDNVAVVVGAMVIAPFLGPNLAFAFGTALADKGLMRRAFLTAVTGIVVAVIFAAVTGYLWPGIPDSAELMSRTSVGIDGVVLAVASGVAGVLSLTTGLSMTLVGVMVAVALLPPAATFGFMLGQGNMPLAIGALSLLTVNIVCVNLSGLLVFLAKGIRPRQWFERRMAKPYIYGGIVFWSLLLGVLVYLI